MANEQISEITTVPTNATVIKIINALIKRYNSLGSNLTTYTSLEQLGITPGQESFASIHSALPINNALEYYAYVNGNFNDEFYPVSNYYGVLQAVKLNGTKTVFSFYAHTVISGNEFSELYLSAYHSSVADTTVWKKVALDSDLTNLSNSVVKSVNGIKPTNGNVLLPLIKNITTNQGVITFTKNDDITTQVDNIKKLYVSTLGENINLNDLTESGIYICASNAYAANYENCPIQKAFLLEVQAANSGDFVYQFLTQYNDGSTEAGNQYVRTYQATNGWSAWRMAGISNNINRKSYNNLASLGLSHQTVTFADIINTLPVNSTLTFYVDVVTSEPSYAPNLQIPASGLVIVVKGASNTIPTLFYLTPIVKGYTSYTGQYTTYNDYGFSGWQPMVLSVNAIKPNINGNVLLPLIKNITTNQGVITFTKNDDITTQVDNIKKLYVSTLGENINLNDLTESGIYICASNAYAANYENCPIQKAFLLEVQAANSGDFVYQFLTQYNDGSTEAGNQYVRTYQATNGWSAWRMAGISNNINRKSYNNLASLGLSHQTVTFADIINTLPVNSTLTFYVDVVTSEPSYAPNLQIPASGLVIVVKGASNTIPTLFYLTPIVKGYTSYTGQYTTYNDYGFSGWQPMVLSVNAIKPNINGNVTIDIPKPVIASEAEAKAGTNNTKFMTPLRVAQAIEAQDGNPIVSASVAGRVITFTKKDGSISTITTQDTTTTNIASITPNYDAGVSVGTSFTAPNIGWILGYFNIPEETGSYAYVNGKVIAYEWGDIASVQILVNQGDVFYTTGTSLNLTFYPCKGA